MSGEITADAVPFTDNSPSQVTRNNTEANNEEDKAMMSSPDRMLESSDSSDSSDTRVNNYQFSAESSNNSRNNTQNIQHQVVIQNPTGVVHLGPVYNLNFGPTQTQTTPNTNNDNSESGKEKPPKEEMRPLWYSKRVVDQEDITQLSKHIGANWKNVGNGLKFDWAKLEQFEADTNTMSDAVLRMLFRWIQWKDQKATVGKLTKVLFNNEEYDAIRCLRP